MTVKIKTLGTHLEGLTGIPFHFVAINETDSRPAATIRKASIDERNGIDQTKKSGFRITQIEVEIFSDDLEELETIADLLIDELDGELIQLAGKPVTCLVTDENDDAYPGQDGSDDWIYGRTLTLRLHSKRGNP